MRFEAHIVLLLRPRCRSETWKIRERTRMRRTTRLAGLTSSFGFRYCFGLRHSTFVILGQQRLDRLFPCREALASSKRVKSLEQIALQREPRGVWIMLIHHLLPDGD